MNYLTKYLREIPLLSMRRYADSAPAQTRAIALALILPLCLVHCAIGDSAEAFDSDGAADGSPVGFLDGNAGANNANRAAIGAGDANTSAQNGNGSTQAPVLAIYNIPSIYQQSTTLSLTVNGQPVPIVQHDIPPASAIPPSDRPAVAAPTSGVANQYAHFSSSGNVDIEITKTTGTIGSYTIYPLAAAIPATKNGSKLSFSFKAPQYLVVQIDALTKLLILADPAEVDAPQLGQPNVVNAQALALNTTNNTAVLQTAINQISANGGGVLYFPEGVYPTGTLDVLSNVTLYLAGGAVLLGCTDASAFPVYAPPVGQSANNTIPAMTLLRSLGQTNVNISGRGTIDANFDQIVTSQPLHVSNIRVAGNNNVQIQGVLSRGGSYWTNIIGNSNNVLIDQIKVVQHEIEYENDGVDICNSSNVTVRNSFVLSGDDAFSVKSYLAGNPFIISPGKNTPNNTNNILFTDNVIFSNEMGYKVGASIDTPQANITFQNSNIIQAKSIGIAYSYGAATLDTVVFQNLNVDITKSGYGVASRNIDVGISALSSGGAPLGLIKNIVFRNINFNGFGSARSQLYGYYQVGTRAPTSSCVVSQSGALMGVTLQGIKIGGNTISDLTSGHINTNACATGIVFQN